MADIHINELREELQNIYNEGNYDPEISHAAADRALLAYVNDAEVTRLFDQLEKWYA